ncbi:MAG TPA: ABC transporter permease [Vicinamibacterales bacterium]|nr:ABC transporter permease [Vicinamibacterales bacterium]
MYQFLEAASIALQAIWANKLRSLLTVLGNIVAVTSIIAVVSLVQGLNASVQDMIQSQFAADAFTVMRTGITFTEEEQLRAQSNPRVTMADAQAIRGSSPNIGLVMAEIRASTDVRYRGTKVDSVQIRGVTREFISIPTTQIELGRPITPSEFDVGRPVAILGYDTADQLFGQLNPIDKTITIQGSHFLVVGVAPKKGTILGQSQDEWVVVPIEAMQRLFGSRQSLALTVRPSDPSLVEVAKDDTRLALRISRRLRPREPDNFGILSSDTFLNFYSQATTGIFAILIGVVSMSLVVGGIVIMNIMLMVVSERTREIGLRKSLGARRRDILWQILTESITLSTFGGMVGTGLGFLVAWVISQVSPLPAIVESWSVMLGIGVTALVGLFFGLYPAMRAAALDPIEALRRE